MSNRTCARLVFLTCLLAPALALAEAADSAPVVDVQAEASAHLQRGVELFKEDAYRASLLEFQRAYALSPDYRLFYNIGRVQLRLQDYLEATRSYERYLSEGGAAVPSERRAYVEEALTELKRRVGRVQLTVDRAGATVLLDDQPVGTTPLAEPLLVNMGRHRIVVHADDGRSDARVVDVGAGELSALRLTLGPAQEEAQAPRHAPRDLRSVGRWTVLAGALTLAGGVVAAGLSARANDQLEHLLDMRDVDRARVDDRRDALHVRSLTADILLGVGGATLLTGGLLWILGGERRPEPDARRTLGWGIGPGTLRLHGRF